MAEVLIAFQKEYPGEMWLEVFVLDGINATEDDALHFKHWIERISPQKVHLNTAVRPTAEAYARQVPMEVMAKFCSIIGQRAEVIVPFRDTQRHDERRADIEEDLLNLLARRPCSLEDISSGLNVHKSEILKYVEPLVKNHRVEEVRRGSVVYYQPKVANDT
jgi:wyosine [tRNA(Phe)-imidazoG37] synthetase (radical SAM superfamily)